MLNLNSDIMSKHVSCKKRTVHTLVPNLKIFLSIKKNFMFTKTLLLSEMLWQV